jgi:alkaline phosphatase D
MSSRRHGVLRSISLSLVFLPAALLPLSVAAQGGPHLATGIKIGEVSDRSAIVWTRLTAAPRQTPPPLDYTPPREVEAGQIESLPAAVPGMVGSVSLVLSTGPSDRSPMEFAPVAVSQATDYTHQFRLDRLSPATKYIVNVRAHHADGPQTAEFIGSFTTAPPADQWQDVRFAVMSCQAHRSRDEVGGFRLYRSMQRARLHFYVATGDNVYYDNDPPNATTVPLARFHWQRMYGQPLLVDFHGQVPGYWEKDDHDLLRDDCWPPAGRSANRDDALAGELTFFKGLKLFREQVPMGEKTYRTFRWGQGLQVWLVEGRDFRSPNNMPDGPDKTIWGREQLDWLKEGILASDAEFQVLVSPTPIVGPDRPNKRDNHSNAAFAHEGNAIRNWIKDNGLTERLFICNGDRHWQYHSIDPATGVHEFSCGPISDKHAGGSPGQDERYHQFHRMQGGFLTVTVGREGQQPTIAFRHHDVDGRVVYEKRFERQRRAE